MNTTSTSQHDKAVADQKGSSAKDLPAAGPHDKPELQDQMKTPGAGSLPKTGSQDADVGPD
ncbi:hypothetical protein [Rhizobium glycinendophyticum]|uniref:Uncharacterized protein n=1 Tax=Rhizobium glycinendophyticum TaxID=2589807 RepID=A0A504UEZ0_9HYPH|nr:hypothetical protein [Rhizobium glycinendophyticum]TPP05431.1 hypothetical protein FJQ55_20690 [Rhizobium glycinendophyticum]